MTINYPYWNNDEVISSDKLNSMVQAIVNGDPLAVKVSNATKNDVNQIISYLSSLYNSAKTNLNSATSTSDLDTAYTNMTALVSNKLGSYANDDTVDLYSTGIRASIITFLQAYDNMMSKDRLNNKNTDNTLSSRIDNEAKTRSDADTSINNSLNTIKANGGGRNLLMGTAKCEFLMNSNNSTQSIKEYDDVTNYIQDTSNTPTDRMGSWWALTPEVGQVYTLSADVCGNGHIQGENFRYEGGDVGSLGQVDLTNDWQRISNTFHVNAIIGNWTIYADNSTLLKVKHIKIEKGMVAHDWSPAPEDTDAKITALDGKTMQNRGTVNAPDFNSLTQAGYYTVINSSGGQNYPTTNWGTLDVSGQVADANGRLNQKYVGDTGGTIYTRQYNAGTKVWTSWVQMANTNDVDAKVNSVLSNGGGVNLVAQSDLKGGYIRKEDGGVTGVATDDFHVDRYIPTNGSTVFTFSSPDYTFKGSANCCLAMYDSDKKYLGSQNITTATQTLSNPNTAYIRFSINFVQEGGTMNGLSDWLSSHRYKLEKGAIAHDWQPAPEDFDNYASGRTITLPHNSSITIKDDRIVSQVYLPRYFTDHTPVTNLDYLADHGECDNLFIPSATMATLNNRPTNPDTNASLTGDCFYSCHYAYSGTTIRAFQKIYSCDYNYIFIRSYNSSSSSWTNWSCLTPYA